jgi:hypothetical protein
MAVELRGLNQANDRSSTLARPQAPRKQPVLAPERNRPDRVLELEGFAVRAQSPAQDDDIRSVHHRI